MVGTPLGSTIVILDQPRIWREKLVIEIRFDIFSPSSSFRFHSGFRTPGLSVTNGHRKIFWASKHRIRPLVGIDAHPERY